MMARILLLIIFISMSAIPAAAELDRENSEVATNNEEADLETLLLEAQTFFLQKRPIDARAKLQKALRVAPKDYRPHMMLGTYYLAEVGHFRLANKYLLHAEKLFLKTYDLSKKEPGSYHPKWQEHSRILYLLAESRLNLDNYQGALDTLEEYESSYWDSWFPGTKSWVLWKLGRTEEAIRVAQEGLLRGANPGKTYNILGILFSSVDNRALALQSYANAIRSEKMLGSLGMISTPLNNSGEVYRESFKDSHAEASWIKALSFPDGCEHVLPSLNLAILYIDELRLLQAERVLADFEACYAANAVREDTEHKGLLSLARGRIALRKGEVNKAVEILERTAASTQWFGRIGTNENDFRFANTIALGIAYLAKAESLEDRQSSGVKDYLHSVYEQKLLRLKSWWLMRRAREIALDELNDFEDLWIRHTDAMLEYPTLGEMLAGYPERTAKARLLRMVKDDNRDDARNWYKLYLGENLLEKGELKEAEDILSEAHSKLRNRDRLARAQAITKLLLVKQERNSSWFSGSNEKDLAQMEALKEELFELLPSQFRYYDLALPVTVKIQAQNKSFESELENLAEDLTEARFLNQGEGQRFQLLVSQGDDKGKVVSLQLYDSRKSQAVASISRRIDLEAGDSTLFEDFYSAVFRHRSDPAGETLPKLTILE